MKVVRKTKKANRYTAEEKALCVRLYRDHMLTAPEIAQKTGFSMWTIRKWVGRNRPQSDVPRPSRKPERKKPKVVQQKRLPPSILFDEVRERQVRKDLKDLLWVPRSYGNWFQCVRWMTYGGSVVTDDPVRYTDLKLCQDECQSRNKLV